MYRVDLEIMHREIFGFRFRPQTGSRLFFANRKLERSEPEVENVLDEKRIKFCCVSAILLFCYFEQGRRQRLLKNFASYVRLYTHTRKKWFLWLPGLKNNKTKIEIPLQKSTSFRTRYFSISGYIVFYLRFTKNSQVVYYTVYTPKVSCKLAPKVDSPWGLN